MSRVLRLLSSLRQGGARLWTENNVLRFEAPKGVITPDQLAEMRELKAEICGFLDGAKLQSEASSVAALRRQKAPLSFAQEQLWVLGQVEDLGSAYDIPMAIRLKGSLNADALQRSLTEILRRHDVLRARIDPTADDPVQIIDAPAAYRLDTTDLSRLGEGEGAAALAQRISGFVSEPFVLTDGSLFRAHLVKLSVDEHILLFNIQHIVFDGWSRGVLSRELAALYSAYSLGLPSPLSELPLQYADYAIWQRERLQGRVIAEHIAYWRAKLSGAPPFLDLPTDRARPPVKSFRGDRVSLQLPRELSDRIKDVATSEAVTPYMFMLSAFLVLLSWWSGQRDIVVGTPVANRTRLELEGLIGLVANILVLRVDISPDSSFTALLARVREVALDAYSHDELPFEKLVEVLHPRRDLSRQPLVQVLFALQNVPVDKLEMSGLDANWTDISSVTSKFDLSVYLYEMEEGVSGCFEFAAELFSQSTVEQMILDFRAVLEAVVAAPRRPLVDLWNAIAPLGVQIAISSSFTADVAVDPLLQWTERIGLTSSVRMTGFDQVFQALLAAPSFTQERHQFHVILLRLEDWGRRQEGSNGSGDGTMTIDVDLVERNVLEFVDRLGVASQIGRGYCLVGICPQSPGTVTSALSSQLAVIEARLTKAIQDLPRVLIVPVATTLEAFGVSSFHDSYLDEMARIPYSENFFFAAATAIMRSVLSTTARPCKVLVVDCDNTLWLGICGEDGAAGVTVTPGRRQLQEVLVELVKRGILVCLCSRNDEADVFAVFQTNPGMVISLDEIVAHRIGWNAKCEAMAELADELDLGLDSFVFLDDDAVECAKMEAQLPEVLTLKVPTDDDAIGSFLNRLWMFDGAGSTSEDRARTQRYVEERRRSTAKQQAASLSEFIKSLGLRVSLGISSASDVERMVQIAERTTQFNTSGVRLTLADAKAIVVAPDTDAFIVTASDRFGDYGRSGLIVVDRSEPIWRVVLFALSCRVLGRDVEFEVLEQLVEKSSAALVEGLAFDFRATPRNAPAERFLLSLQRLGGLTECLLSTNVFPIHSLKSALERRRSGDPVTAPRDVAAERASTQQRPTGAGADLVAPHRRFCRLVAAEYGSVDDRAATFGRSVRRVAAPPAEHEAPRTSLEKTLCRIWRDVLRVERVGIDDNFFELGGHSLLATRVIARMRGELNVEMPLRAMFETPTIAELAGSIDRNRDISRSKRSADLNSKVSALSPEEVRSMLRELRREASGDRIGQ